MARTNQVSQRVAFLSQTIPGYRGYTSPKNVYKTDQLFSEEVLSMLSETMATVRRMKRTGEDSLSPDCLASLDSISDTTESLAKKISDTIPVDGVVGETIESGRADEIVDLDSDILEKLGNINQALSMMDLEGGVGISPEELESVCELLDDLGDSLRQRAMLFAG
jgi:hypothetical protein